MERVGAFTPMALARKELREHLSNGAFMNTDNEGVNPRIVELLAELSKALPPELEHSNDVMAVSDAIAKAIRESEGN